MEGLIGDLSAERKSSNHLLELLFLTIFLCQVLQTTVGEGWDHTGWLGLEGICEVHPAQPLPKQVHLEQDHIQAGFEQLREGDSSWDKGRRKTLERVS